MTQCRWEPGRFGLWSPPCLCGVKTVIPAGPLGLVTVWRQVAPAFCRCFSPGGTIASLVRTTGCAFFL